MTAGTMQWVSAVSRAGSTERAVAEVCDAVVNGLAAEPPDFVLAFFTAAHADHADTIRSVLAERLEPGSLAGLGAAGVISSEEEIQGGAALSILAARLPGVTVSPFLIGESHWFDPIDDPVQFEIHAPGVSRAHVLLLFADPFSLDVNRVLEACYAHAPQARVAGGMGSLSQEPDGNLMFLNDWTGKRGGIGIALGGAVRADFVVSQGCRPMGPPLRVTQSQHNVVHEFDGLPAGERVAQVVRDLTPKDRELLSKGILVGRPVRPEAQGRGDYLVRNLIAHDPKTGALAVGDLVGDRELLRLHARDAATAREDLELLLAPQAFDRAADAALVFSCTGRGRNLYAAPNGDLGPLQEALGGVPIAGCFCAGEIGPVGDRSYLHGHTASIVILRPR